MYIWIGNIVFLLIYSILLSAKGKIIDGKETTVFFNVKKTSILLIIMFLQLLFLYVFNQHSIFPDINSYLQGFEYSLRVDWHDVPKIQHFSTEIKFELGWCYYTKILSFIHKDSGILLLATGTIIILSYFILINKYALIPWLSIFLFITTVFYNSLFVLRQNLAAAICLFSVPYIIERKLWKFLLLVFIAFTIHQTALIFVLLYIIYPLKIDRRFFILVISLGILFYTGFQFALNFAATYLSGYGIYKTVLSTTANATALFISLCVFVFIWVYSYPFNQMDDVGKLLFQMMVVFVMIDLSRIGLPGTIGRLNLYFYPAVILLLPNTVKRVEKPGFKYVSIILITVLYFILMIKQMNYGFELIF
jgi:hypothetical protein